MVCSRVIVAADTHTGALIAAACGGGGHRLAPLSRLMSERMHTKWGPPGPSMYSLLSFPSLFLESPFAVHDSAERVPTCSTAHGGGVRVLEMQFTAHTTHTKHCCSRVRSQHTHKHTLPPIIGHPPRAHTHSHRLRHRDSGTMATTTTLVSSSLLRAQSGPTLVTQLNLQ